MAGNENYSLPMGLCRQAAKKIDSFIADVYEIREYEGLSPEDRENFGEIAGTAGQMLAAIITMAGMEAEEEDFLSGEL